MSVVAAGRGGGGKTDSSVTVIVPLSYFFPKRSATFCALKGMAMARSFGEKKPEVMVKADTSTAKVKINGKKSGVAKKGG